MVSLKREAVEERLTKAVKYVYAIRSTGQDVTAAAVSRLFHISNAYTPIFTGITGDETDIQGLCNESIKMAKEINRQRNCRRTADTPDVAPDTDIRLLRDEIRKEVYAEISDRQKENDKARFESIARRNLEILVAARPKEDDEFLAKKAINVTRRFLHYLERLYDTI